MLSAADLGEQMRTCEDGNGRRDHIEFPAVDEHCPEQVRDAVTACVANQLHEAAISWSGGKFTMSCVARTRHHVRPVCLVASPGLLLDLLLVVLGITWVLAPAPAHRQLGPHARRR